MGWNRSFNMRPQQNLIRRRGTCVKWTKTSPCPCAPEGRASDPNCLSCDGTGRAVRGSKLIWGIISDVLYDRALVSYGVAQYGDLVFSQMPGSTCEQLETGDRIVLSDAPDGEPFEGEKLKRGTGDTDDLQYQVFRMLDVISVDAGSGVQTSYTKNTDYITSGNQITWISANRPPSRSIYSVKYRARFEWGVWRPPHIRYEGSGDLGQKVILTRRPVSDNDNEQ